jgi:hypothetical protein
MTSHSQYGEDVHIFESVKGVGSKRLLDIGAWHATQFSNSRALIDDGWEAILIEPSPGPLAGLVRDYAGAKNVAVIGALVGISNCLQLLKATDDAVSTTEAGVSALWAESGGYYGSFYSPTITIGDIFNQFGGGFEFVNIDAEGVSVSLFAEFLRLGGRPKCFCVEHDGRVVEIVQHAQAAGYRQIHLNGTNVIFER